MYILWLQICCLVVWFAIGVDGLLEKEVSGGAINRLDRLPSEQKTEMRGWREYWLYLLRI